MEPTSVDTFLILNQNVKGWKVPKNFAQTYREWMNDGSINEPYLGEKTQRSIESDLKEGQTVATIVICMTVINAYERYLDYLKTGGCLNKMQLIAIEMSRDISVENMLKALEKSLEKVY